MIENPTYDGFARKGVVHDFDPSSQQAMASAIIRHQGALPYTWAGDLEAAFSLMNRRWPSLPGGRQQELTEDEAERHLYHRLGERRP